MSEEDFGALVHDIHKNGLREHGWIFEGMILDGWHRHKACIAAGKPFRHEPFTGTDPVGFVLSKNTQRRHLTASQRAAAVAMCAAWAKSGDNQHSKGGGAPGAPPAQTVEEAAKSAGVSKHTMQQAKAAVEAGLGEEVRDGKMSAKAAAAAAKPKKPKKPKPEKPLDPKDKRIAALEKENAELREKVEELTSDLEQALAASEASVEQAIAAADMLKTEPAVLLLKARGEIKRLERLRDDYMNQIGQLVKQNRMIERKLSKYEGRRAA
jgi:hypothetical protein